MKNNKAEIVENIQKIALQDKNFDKIITTMYRLSEQPDRVKLPSIVEIAKHTGLSAPTVSVHLKDFRDQAKSNSKIKNTLQNYMQMVLFNSVKLSKKSVAAQRLLFEVAGLLDSQQQVTNQQVATFNIIRNTDA